MEEKKLFVKTWLKRELSMAALCRAFSITPKTGYKWLERFQERGELGLAELSRARHFHPNATADEVVQLLIEARRQRPTLGPRKLRAMLQEDWPELQFPAASTIGDILRRNGLVAPRRRRSRTGTYTGPLAAPDRPNEVWAADFKGHFQMEDRRRCYPFTVTDTFSRYLIRCDAYLGSGLTVVRRSLERAFVEYGLPVAIRTDNGPPFATRAPGGISQLGVWLVRLGVRPERIEPGKPQQNGRHERFHRTLKQETPPGRNRPDQQRAFDGFKLFYNHHRPHEALGQKPPASVYEPSRRTYPCLLRDPCYGDEYELERVRTDGSLRWNGRSIYLTEILSGELVGLLRQPDDTWSVDFGPYHLGTIRTDRRFTRSRR